MRAGVLAITLLVACSDDGQTSADLAMGDLASSDLVYTSACLNIRGFDTIACDAPPYMECYPQLGSEEICFCASPAKIWSCCHPNIYACPRRSSHRRLLLSGGAHHLRAAHLRIVHLHRFAIRLQQRRRNARLGPSLFLSPCSARCVRATRVLRRGAVSQPCSAAIFALTHRSCLIAARQLPIT